jgi:hypothetical protein
MDLVKVAWTDIHSCDDPWISVKEAKEMRPVSMETVGYLLEKTKDYVTVISTACEDGETVGSVNAIPMGVVKCVVPLKTDPESCSMTDCCSKSSPGFLEAKI